MTDEADAANDSMQRELDNKLANLRKLLDKRELQPCGHCYYCNHPVDELRVFCDRGCAEDFEAFNKHKNRR